MFGNEVYPSSHGHLRQLALTHGWLVGGLEHEFYDFPFRRTHVFQRGSYTTNQMELGGEIEDQQKLILIAAVASQDFDANLVVTRLFISLVQVFYRHTYTIIYLDTEKEICFFYIHIMFLNDYMYTKLLK